MTDCFPIRTGGAQRRLWQLDCPALAEAWACALGGSIFVDETLVPYPDQWAFLACIQPMPVQDIAPTTQRATGGRDPLGVTAVADEDELKPWHRKQVKTQKLACPDQLGIIH